MTKAAEPEAAPPRPAAERLFRWLALVWSVLTVYGSLYPFSGGARGAIDPFAWLNLRWPQYWTAFDMGVNVLVYLPLGFCVTLALRGCFRRRLVAPFLATLWGVFLSFAMESLQSWLPSRVASNLDLLCNSLGTLAGSLIAAWCGPRLLALWLNLRQRLFAPAPHVDLGLALLGLWLLALLAPENILFGTGRLHALAWLPAPRYDPGSYRFLEGAAVAANLLAVGLFAAAMTQGRWLALPMIALLFSLAFLIQGLGAALFLGPEDWLAWCTPGAAGGLRAGFLLLGIVLLLPPACRTPLAALALLLATLLAYLVPADPYTAATGMRPQWQNHFLNFKGLTRWIASIWPFLALPYLFLAHRRFRISQATKPGSP
ncbi:MAG: VanZ family protein [Zoogloeaceae bacterium]|jgi:VanZ family protein|nr:VanZ family protein [Zoogloeaceae bacterium]